MVSSNKYKENIKSAIKGDKEESEEPAYDEDEDQLEEMHEEQTGETSEATINEVF